MAQHDMNIANQGFPATRADLNNALQALVSNSSGTSAPSTTFANQWWYDTTNNKLYIRNEANNAWIEVAILDQTNNEWQITTGVIQAKDGDGLALKTDDGTTRLSIADADGMVTMGQATLSTDGNEDTLVLKSNDADANAGPKLQFNRNSASPADADLIGEMRFSGRNDASQAVDYVTMSTRIEDATDGTEDGKIILKTIVNGTARSRMEIDHTDAVFNQDSIDSNFRVEGDSDSNLFFCDAGNNTVRATTGGYKAQFETNGDGVRVVTDNVGHTMGFVSGGSYAQGSNHSFVKIVGGTGGNVQIVANNTGVILNRNASSFSSGSDIRLKNITGTFTNAIEDIKTIEPIKFTWKSDENNIPHVGLSAQSVQPVLPEAVDNSALVDGDDTEYLSVRYTEVIPLLTAALQEAVAKIETLEARITALENA